MHARNSDQDSFLFVFVFLLVIVVGWLAQDTKDSTKKKTEEKLAKSDFRRIK